MDNPRYDIVLGAVSGLIGVGLLWPTYDEGARVFLLPGDISPYFAPKVFLFCWIALSAAILVKGVVALPNWSRKSYPPKWGAVFAAFAVAIAATGLMPPLGYLVVAPVGVFATVWLLGYSNHVVNAVVSVAVSVGLYLMLSRLAGLSLPGAFWQA